MRSERRTVKPALRGDEAELFRRHGDWLVRVTRLRLQCTQELAEDAAAHAWVPLCRTQPERTDKLPGWLRVVALYEGYQLLRKQTREPLVEDVCRQEAGAEGTGDSPGARGSVPRRPECNGHGSRNDLTG